MDNNFSPNGGSRSPGRPREFDMDEALDRAITVFSERGFHGTSISELQLAMGVTSGSLYKAFKDKKAIFLAAFERYKLVRDGILRASLEDGANGRDKVHRMLRFYGDASHGDMGRRGCLVVSTATELALFDPETAAYVGRALTRNESLLEGLIREGHTDGSISASTDAPTVARLLLCLMQGLRVVGKTGPDRERALAVVDAAMKILD